MAEEDVKATLAVGLLQGLINSGVIRLRTHNGQDEIQSNRAIFESVARMTEDLHAALFPPGKPARF